MQLLSFVLVLFLDSRYKSIRISNLIELFFVNSLIIMSFCECFLNYVSFILKPSQLFLYKSVLTLVLRREPANMAVRYFY